MTKTFKSSSSQTDSVNNSALLKPGKESLTLTSDSRIMPNIVKHQSVPSETGSSFDAESQTEVIKEAEDYRTPEEKTEGTLQLVIKNFSEFEKQNFPSDATKLTNFAGPITKIENVYWRILILRKHYRKDGKLQKYIGLFLQIVPNYVTKNWSCEAAIIYRLVSQNPKIPNFERANANGDFDKFYAKQLDWGYSNFILWSDVMDKSKGFLKKNIVIFEIEVKIKPPVNIWTLQQFQRKIEAYIELSKHQFNAGKLDKAIEICEMAKKICNNQDPETQQKLNDHFVFLMGSKVRETIQRLEFKQ